MKVVAVAGGISIDDVIDHLPGFRRSVRLVLVYSVESTLSPNSTPYTRMFGYEAMKMSISGYKAVAEAGPAGSPERRVKRNELMRDFLIASDYAGISFDTGGCAAVHALNYQLGGKNIMCPTANPTTPCSPACYATIWRSSRKARSLR